MALMMFVCNLEGLKMESFDMLTQIFRETLIKEDLLHDTSSQLGVVLSVERLSTKASKEVIWLKGLFGELSGDLQVSTLFCDSQISIYLSKDQMFDERTKHIEGIILCVNLLLVTTL